MCVYLLVFRRLQGCRVSLFKRALAIKLIPPSAGRAPIVLQAAGSFSKSLFFCCSGSVMTLRNWILSITQSLSHTFDKDEYMLKIHPYVNSLTCGTHFFLISCICFRQKYLKGKTRFDGFLAHFAVQSIMVFISGFSVQTLRPNSSQ